MLSLGNWSVFGKMKFSTRETSVRCDCSCLLRWARRSWSRSATVAFSAERVSTEGDWRVPVRAGGAARGQGPGGGRFPFQSVSVHAVKSAFLADKHSPSQRAL